MAGPTLRSAQVAIEHASDAEGVAVELIVVLDRANEATRSLFQSALGATAQFHLTDFGDPGQARNFGVANSQGAVVTVLDGDDLWSKNWLTNGWRFAQEHPHAIGHCACIVTFDAVRGLWWHIDSERHLYDPLYLVWGNYWDAMVVARREIFEKFPYKPNNLAEGFGHEDWHWNCVTLDQGVPHKPVPQTIHFKRRRAGSQMSLVEKSDSTVWPTPLPPQRKSR